MSKIDRIHYHRAQRIYDRLGRGSVADIDAIAQALADAERLGRDDTDSANLLSIIADIREKSGLGAKPMLGDLAGAIAERIAEAERVALERGFLGGFACSAEGYNGENPFDDGHASPLNDERWVKCRDTFVAAILSEAES